MTAPSLRHAVLLVVLLLAAWPAWAQVPVVNQSTCTLSWTAPTTNADATPLTDLAGYRVYVAPTVTALAALTVATATVTAASAAPAANTTVTWPCKTLPLGAGVAAVTAFDTATPPNESARTPPFPFVLRDDVSPSAPSNVRTP